MSSPLLTNLLDLNLAQSSGSKTELQLNQKTLDQILSLYLTRVYNY